MNDFFYESRGKEKVQELRNEGENSQAFHRSGAQSLGLLLGLPKLIIGILGILGILGMLLR